MKRKGFLAGLGVGPAFASTLALSVSILGGPALVRAQTGDEGERPCGRSFAAIESDPGAPNVFTVPLARGSFADVEIATTSEGTTRVEVDAFEEGALRERRISVVVTRRVLVVSELFEVESLFELGRPLVLRIESDEPLRVILVRGD